MAQRTKKVAAMLYLERVTLQDKARRITMPQPREYRLSINAEVGEVRVVLREFVFLTKAEQTEHYELLRRVLAIDPK